MVLEVVHLEIVLEYSRRRAIVCEVERAPLKRVLERSKIVLKTPCTAKSGSRKIGAGLAPTILVRAIANSQKIRMVIRISDIRIFSHYVSLCLYYITIYV